MKVDIKTIISDSNRIYNALAANIRYLYSELQELTRLSDTQLCLALCQLLRDGRICRLQVAGVIYYQKGSVS